MAIVRGEIYWAFLDPSFGREMGGYKERPVVVVSTEDIHEPRWGLPTIVPGTSNTKHRARNLVIVTPSKTNGLKEATVFQAHQVRAIDRGRLIRGPIGRLDKDDLNRLDDAMLYSLGINRKT